MTENQAAAEAAYSTHIDAAPAPDAALPAALPDAPQPEAKPEQKTDTKPLSNRDTVAKAFDDLEAKDKAGKEPVEAKDANEKPAVEKQQKQPEAKEEPKNQPEKAEKSAAPAKDDATGQDGTEKSRQSEGRNHHEPPARFLPKAKEVWANVPHAVKGEIARMAQEHEAEVAQYRQGHDEWQKLDKFAQMAKQHNTSVSDALERYTAVDALLHSNPIEGIRQVLATLNITPEAYAQHVLQNPDAHRAPTPRAPDPQDQRTTAQIQQLQAEIESMRHEQAARSIIEPFRAANPRYDELQDDIAFFLSSGKIPASLSPQERLEAAYDMAVRINPTSSIARQDASPEPDDAIRVPSDAGTKSIKGAPTPGIASERGKPAKNNREAVQRAIEQLGF